MPGKIIFSKQQPPESQTANRTKPSLAIIAVMFVVVFLFVAGVATPVSLSGGGRALHRTNSHHLISSTVAPTPATTLSIPAEATTSFSSISSPSDYPIGNWQIATPQEVGMDPVLFAAAMNELPSPAVVIRNGRIVGQKGDIARPGYIWSASKSLVALLVARSLQRGQIAHYDVPVPNSNVPSDPPATFRQFMSMTSDYNLTPHSPGNHYAYNNGAAHFYGTHLRSTFYPGKTEVQMLQEAYASALGFQDPVSYAGYLSGWDGGWSMSTRDLARISYLVLRNGNWNGEQILPPSFINDLYNNQIPAGATPATATTDDFYNQVGATAALPGAYSFGFWLPHHTTIIGGSQSQTEATSMLGAFGTTVHISRSKDLVIVGVNTTPDDHGGAKISGAVLDLFAASITGLPTPTPTPTPSPSPTPTPTPSPSPTPTPTPSPSPTPATTFVSNLVTAPTGEHLHNVVNGSTINLADLATRSLTINVVPTAPVGSIRLHHNEQVRTENEVPYSLAGDTNGHLNPADLFVGTHTVTVIPYPEPNLGGTPGIPTTFSFTVVDAPSTPPTLLTEENSDRAIALNAATFATQPFTRFTETNFSSDKRTRVMLFITYVGAPATGVDTVVNGQHPVNGTFSLPIEHIGTVPNFDWLTQVTVILPDGFANAGEVWVRVVLRGLSSNQARINVTEPAAALTMRPSRMSLLVDSWTAPISQLDSKRFAGNDWISDWLK
jgi:CubicO group peptidase (beta-lactamase class C family)